MEETRELSAQERKSEEKQHKCTHEGHLYLYHSSLDLKFLFHCARCRVIFVPWEFKTQAEKFARKQKLPEYRLESMLQEKRKK